MPTNTAATTARQYHQAVIHYLRKQITFEDTTVTVGILPAGALLLKLQSSANVTTAFDAGTSNTIHVGTTADNDLYATGLAAGTVAQVPFDEFTAGNLLSADTTITATYNKSGTAPTAGSAEIVVAYTVDNDG